MSPEFLCTFYNTSQELFWSQFRASRCRLLKRYFSCSRKNKICFSSESCNLPVMEKTLHEKALVSISPYEYLICRLHPLLGRIQNISDYWNQNVYYFIPFPLFHSSIKRFFSYILLFILYVWYFFPLALFSVIVSFHLTWNPFSRTSIFTRKCVKP